MTENAKWVDEAWRRTVEKIGRTSKRIGASFPHISIGGKYDSTQPQWWTSGFWSGLLWLLHRETGDPALAALAAECEEKMDPVLQGFYKLDHDIGFMWSLTAVAHYKLQRSEDSKRRALTAASHLAGRFNLRGHFIRAWHDNQTTNRAGWVIIDCMMNLPILYWASETLNDPRYKFIAMAHADTVLSEFVRPDGSVHHIVCFDPESGQRVEALAGQGHSPDSAWSRGNAWALHGFILSYRYTREQRYLDAAKKIAHFFIAALPDDQVPPWDFRAPLEERFEAVDSTAAACAASALLEISQFVDPLESRLYYDAGSRIVNSLYENCGAWDEEEEALITKGTVYFRSERYPNNVPLIYGDFFFVEALTKLKGQRELLW